MSSTMLLPQTADETGAERPGLSSWYALSVLTLVMWFALADRNIFYLLAEPMRLRLGLSDFQLGMLQGLGVSLCSAVAGLPLGWLADRYDRRWVLVVCVATWSAAVVGCGLARNFNELFVASAIVGIGEAGLIPVVYGLIPSLFFGKPRILANSIFAVATRLGFSIGFFLCSFIIREVDAVRPFLPVGLSALDSWRLSFLVAAMPAPIMVLLVLTIRGSPDTEVRAAVAVDPASGGSSLMQFLSRNRSSFLAFFGGLAAIGFGFSASAGWIPLIARRLYGISPSDVGNAIGTATLVGTILGFVGGVYGVRFFLPRIGLVLPLRVMWLAAATGAMISASMLLTTNVQGLYLLQGLQTAFTIAATMVFPTALQDMSPSRYRSRMAAIVYVVGVLGGAASPLFVGAISDRLKDLPSGLLIAAVVVSTIGLVVAAALLRYAEGRFTATVTDARREDEDDRRALHLQPEAASSL